eukprot:UC4_evm1s1148
MELNLSNSQVSDGGSGGSKKGKKRFRRRGRGPKGSVERVGKDENKNKSGDGLHITPSQNDRAKRKRVPMSWRQKTKEEKKRKNNMMLAILKHREEKRGIDTSATGDIPCKNEKSESSKDQIRSSSGREQNKRRRTSTSSGSQSIPSAPTNAAAALFHGTTQANATTNSKSLAFDDDDDADGGPNTNLSSLCPGEHLNTNADDASKTAASRGVTDFSLLKGRRLPSKDKSVLDDRINSHLEKHMDI